jgi:GntR family histidine utilization transcriptional repressor
VLQLAAVRADALLARSFDLRRGAPLHHSRLLHLENGEPIQLEQRWVNPAVAPEYLEQDFTQLTPNEYLVQVAPLERVEYDIEAAAAAADVRRTLAMQPQEPCLILRRRTWSRGAVASVAVLLHPGSRYRFAGHF